MELLRKFMDLPYVVGALAGALILLGFAPFGLWPLIIPGLALYFLNASYPSRSRKAVWWSGYLTGFLVELWISYQGLGHMALLPGAEGFSRLAHAGPIAVAFLAGGPAFGAVALLFQAVRSRLVLLNALAGASLYTLSEMPQQLASFGYYWASIAHPFTAFPPALTLSSIGGTFLVSFCISWIACLVAESVLQPRAAVSAAGISAAALILLWSAGAASTNGLVEKGSVTVASVQTDNSSPTFSQSENSLGNQARGLLAEAGNGSAGLVVFPWSLAPGAFYLDEPYRGVIRGQAITESLGAHNSRLSGAVASGTVALVWPQVYDAREGHFYETFQFVESGVATAEYRKQLMHPFSDYYPHWMQALGLATRDDAITPGPSVSHTQVGSWNIGSIDCSELHRPTLARREARESDFLVSMGSDAMFNNSMTSEYSLAAARYRAAENNIPLLRASLAGPSAIIGADGSIIASLPKGKSGILRGDIPFYETRQQTLYNRFGLLPIGLIIVSSVAAALIARRRY
ncbi:MAG: lnt [Candidatus Adlerbacteria bacterium]|nr:lnt [Candidatus Adlerbacteria bacterium]